MIASLRSWIVTICCTLFFITAVEMILPDNSLKKYAKFVLGLLLITVILNPIIKFLDGGVDTAVYTNAAEKYMDNSTYQQQLKQSEGQELNSTLKNFEDNLKSYCENELKNKFPSDTFSVTIEAVYDKQNNEFPIKSVKVGVSDGKVKKIDKVDIGSTKDNTNSSDSVDGQLKDSIVSLISNDLKLDKKLIYVYKL